ncbi:thioredoxin family protein [Agromyces sp. ISL-38]|uniref:thioredoxin family protein n=1 Tax=Agromyces sp. ISL-38 TaxID=2819107 RepID=UPI001BE80AAB|nr:thioredoxin family protein [Agromyces sp. ISL-38]MBT2500280.1 thioredoxin family protein [Agromyces sp. ISL-38]
MNAAAPAAPGGRPERRSDGKGLSIEVLHITECPGWEPTLGLLRRALDELGITEASVSARLISSPDEARRCGFAGSPTVLVDGIDPFPSSGPAEELACRVYRGADGLSPHPSPRDLVAALRERTG